MPTGRVALTGSIAGIPINTTITRTADGQIGQSITLATGFAGTVTTRTSDYVGIITVAASPAHTILNADVVDIYVPSTGAWQYGAVVSAVNGNAISFGSGTPGTGDVLPAGTTAVVICTQTWIDMDFDGNDVGILAISCDQISHADIQQDDHTSLLAVDLAATESYLWAAYANSTNPLANDTVGFIAISNGSTSAATFTVGLLYDSSGTGISGGNQAVI